jgi:hypothetical protein
MLHERASGGAGRSIVTYESPVGRTALPAARPRFVSNFGYNSLEVHIDGTIAVFHLPCSMVHLVAIPLTY